jgi:hypothetical protein
LISLKGSTKVQGIGKWGAEKDIWASEGRNNRIEKPAYKAIHGLYPSLIQAIK